MIKRFFKRLFAKPGLSREPAGVKASVNVRDGGARPVSYHVNKPSIWGHKDHKIDKRLVSHNAIRVCETLQDRGFKAFVVGGAVRDLLLGMRPKDFDVATDASPEEVRNAFRRARIIGRRFQIVHVMFGPETIEVSTFRALTNTSHETDEHGRVLRDNVFGKQDEDATRRDFTVNAMYYDPKTETVWDYHHGMEDIRKRVLRMIGDPATRYREDPVRMMRVVRFAAKLKFNIEPATFAPIAELADLISNVPAARLFDEMLKLLASGSAMSCLRGLRDAGLHKGLFPLLDAILDNDKGEPFLVEALRRTDERVRDEKPLSTGFLFACLMWHQVVGRWEVIQKRGEQKFPALFIAMDHVLVEQCEKTAIPRRITGDMRELWAFQPRFEKRGGKAPFRMVEQPKFRAALDFFELRAHVGEVDSDLAQWWRDFYDAEGKDKQALIDGLRALPGGGNGGGHGQNAHNGGNGGQGGAVSNPAKKRRRKRKPNAGTGTASQGGNGAASGNGAPGDWDD